MLEITHQKNGSSMTVKLTGRLDSGNAHELEETVKDAIGGLTELIFDMEQLSYISSAGLRVLLSAMKTMNRQGTMKLLHVSEAVYEILEVTGFTEFLTIE